MAEFCSCSADVDSENHRGPNGVQKKKRQNRNSSLQSRILILVFSLAFIGFAVFYSELGNKTESGQSLPDSSSANTNDHSYFGLHNLHDPSNLGDGAFAKWKEDGYSIVNENGHANTSVIRIHGKDDQAADFQVTLQAKLGNLTFEIQPESIQATQGQEKQWSIDLNALKNLHPKQLEYALKIEGEVAISTGKESDNGRRAILPTRYLAYNPELDSFEFMDDEELSSRHPFGFTTEAGQKRVQELLDRSEKDGYVLSYIAPDMNTQTEPENEE